MQLPQRCLSALISLVQRGVTFQKSIEWQNAGARKLHRSDTLGAQASNYFTTEGLDEES